MGTIGLGILLMLAGVAVMMVVDYFFDSRVPARARVRQTDGSVVEGDVVEVTAHKFSLKGFLTENGAKLLLIICIAFLFAPMINDSTRIKMEQALQKIDALGKQVTPPTVTDDDLQKITVSSDRKELKLPKMEKTEGEWIVILTSGKAFSVADGEPFKIDTPMDPKTQVMKKSASGQYSAARPLGK